VAGNRIDEAIIEFVRKKHGLAIGDRTAEEIKITIGSAVFVREDEVMEIKGRDMITGLPKIVTMTTNEVVEAIQEELREIVKAVKHVLQETPPELASDIIDKGMVMTGGTAQLKHLGQYISERVGVPCYTAEDPLLCVARGTGGRTSGMTGIASFVSATLFLFPHMYQDVALIHVTGFSYLLPFRSEFLLELGT
jgi:rod shape-determining protein MreB